MRIDGNGSLSGVARGSERRRVNNHGATFSLEEGATTGRSESRSAPSPIPGIDALIALQAVDGYDGPGRRLSHGNEMLDMLEDIKIGLLAGTISMAKLEGLAERLRQRPERGEGAEVEELLDEIELRARVELAKLGREAA